MANQLNYDNQGFIVGIERVENNTKQLHNDTQAILKLLLAQRNAGNDSLQDMNQTLDSIHTSLGRLPASLNRGKTKEYSPRKSSRANSSITPRSSRKTKEYGRNVPTTRTRTTTADNTRSNPALDRQRDAGGRFTAKAEDAKFVDKLSNKLGDTFGKHFNVDDKNLDPLIDGFHEMKDALSPISGVLGFIRDKAEQRRERKHDKAVEDNLETIADNTGGGGNGRGGRGGGFLGGMAGRMMGGLAGSALGGIGGMAVGALGGVGKMATKLGGKRLGLLGTLIGAGSLAMDWGNLDHEGKSAGVGGLVGGAGGAMAGAATGAMIGSVVPVIGTAIGGLAGGLIGGWLGSEGGEVLGKTASPYIQSWTNSLQSYNLGDKLKTAFSFGMNPFFTGVTSLLPSLNDWVAKTTSVDVAKGFAKLWDDIKAKLGFGSPSNPSAPSGSASAGGVSGSDMIAGEGWSAGMGGSPSSKAIAMADHAATYAKTGEALKHLGGCAKYVNDAARAVGYKASGDGKDVADNLYKMNPGKFERVNYTPGMQLQEGDVVSLTAGDHNAARQRKKFHGTTPGHTFIRTKKGNVSDFNQGESWGNKGYEEDIKNGSTKVTIVRPINPNGGGGASGAVGRTSGSIASSGLKGNQQRAYNSARANGLSDTAARALVANMSGESLSNPSDTKGDHGKAQGIVQWHSPRANAIQKKFGKLPKDMSVEDQTSAAIWEMKTNPDYRPTWNALNGGGSAESMVSTLVRNYERPGDTNKAISQRVQHLRNLSVSSGQAIPQSKLQATATSKKGMTPASIPASKKEKIPKPPVVNQKISSDDDDDNKKGGWLSNITMGNFIAQNLSDRALAHVVTGGLGEDRFWI